MIPPSSRLLSTSSVGCCRVNFHLDSIYIFLPLVLVYVKTSLSVVVLKGIGMHYFSPLQKYSNFSFVIPPHREQERTLFVFVFIVIIKVLTTTISYPNCFLSRDCVLASLISTPAYSWGANPRFFLLLSTSSSVFCCFFSLY